MYAQSLPPRGLSDRKVKLLTEEIRKVTPRLSREQILDVADALHAIIRQRRPGQG